MQQAAQIYGQVAKKTLAPRDLEAQLLIKAANKLLTAKETWETPECNVEEALMYNRKLWVVLTTSATNDKNPLPQEIKNNIGSLGVFILKHTNDLLGKPYAGGLTVLININKELAAGLRARSQNAAEPSMATSGVNASF